MSDTGLTLADAGLSVASDTVGVLWRAASGTVDPFTKEQLIAQQAQDLARASGGDPANPTAANTAQAQTDVTNLLTQATADPSQFGQGVQASLGNLLSAAKTALGTTQGIVVALAVLAGILVIGYMALKVG